MEDDFPNFVDTFRQAIRQSQKLSGVETDVLVKLIGKEIGWGVADKVGSDTVDAIIDELGTHLFELGLGVMILDPKKGILTVERCTGCERIPIPGESGFCKFRASLLEAIFQRKLSEPIKVEHLYSSGTGTGRNTCHFQMSKT